MAVVFNYVLKLACRKNWSWIGLDLICNAGALYYLYVLLTREYHEL